MTIRTSEEHAGMRESNRIASEVLDLLTDYIKPGITTGELNRISEDYLKSKNALAAFKGYSQGGAPPYPASICTSINEEVVHGIPGDRELKEGDIISIDVGVKLDGFFGDSARTYSVGKIDEKKRHLMEVTREALKRGINEARTGNRVHDISATIQEYVESAGYSIIREMVGHGIGKNLHEEPPVPNYGKRGTGIELQEGMVLAIEPMVNLGSSRIKIASDGWTVLAADGLPSAHFEHTIVVRNGSAEILTM